MTDKILIVKDGESHEIDLSRIKIEVSKDKKIVSISDNCSGVDFPLKVNSTPKTFRCNATCMVEVELEATASNFDDAKDALMDMFSKTSIDRCVRKNISLSPIVEIL